MGRLFQNGENKMKHHTRSFASRWGFILASVGSAVGMANVWGFPNKLGSNGGGAFLLIYLLFVIIFSYVGLPAEFAMGRRAATGTLGAYRSAWATRGEKAGKSRRCVGLAAAGRLALHRYGYAVIVTLCPQGALVDSPHRHADDCRYRRVVRSFSSQPYSVILTTSSWWSVRCLPCSSAPTASRKPIRS